MLAIESVNDALTSCNLEEEHPDTLTSMNNLAFIWKSHGREHDALRLMKECFLLRKQRLGADHPDTVSSFETIHEWELADLAMEQ